MSGKTKEKTNFVGHCDTGKHDKIYMACIRRCKGGWVVVGKWGRRGYALKEQEKEARKGAGVMIYKNRDAAMYAAQELFAKKQRSSGYRNIDDADYSGPVTYGSVKDYLEGDDPRAGSGKMDTTPTLRRPYKKKPVRGRPRKTVVEPEELVLRCTDNKGYEDLFDVGVTYLAVRTDDPDMFRVTDKMGEDREVFADRFEVTDEE